jgi:hypothetical protein
MTEQDSIKRLQANRRPIRLTGFLIAACAMAGACPAAFAFADTDPVVSAAAPEIAVPAPVDVVVETAPYAAVTSWQRLKWFDEKTFGVSNLGGSIPGAAWQTLMDRPAEAGPHWKGFGERYGVSVSTNAVSNAMEAGLGAIWGEDPRYRRDGSRVAFKSRLGHVVKWTVVAPDRNGELRPAYARFLAYSGSSFASDAWREPSDTSAGHSVARIGLAFLGRMGSNAFDEFWPDTKRMIFHRGAGD